MDGYDGSFHTYDEVDFDDDGGGGGRSGRRRRKKGGKPRRRWGREEEAEAPSDPFAGLAVVGRACRLHRDDSTAAALEAGSHLVELFESSIDIGGGGDHGYGFDDGSDGGGRDRDEGEKEDDDGCLFADPPTPIEGNGAERQSVPRSGKLGAKKLLVDRHDVRSLLDPSDLEPVAASRASSGNEVAGGEDEENKREMNFERYGALPEYRRIFLGEDDDGAPTEQQNKMGVEGSIGDDERFVNLTAPGDNEDADREKRKEITTEKSFRLEESEIEALPSGMVTPTDRRINEVIRMTASRAAAAPQFEVMLKLRQSSNPEFAFLLPGQELHPYYLFLRENGGTIPAVLREQTSKTGEEGEGNSDDGNGGGEGVLGGLLGMYSSSDDGSDDEGIDASAGEEGKDGCCASMDAAKDDSVTKDSPLPIRAKSVKRRVNQEVSDGSSQGNEGSAGAATNADCVVSAASSSSVVPAISTADDELRARRLKRARLLRGHFAQKLREDATAKK